MTTMALSFHTGPAAMSAATLPDTPCLVIGEVAHVRHRPIRKAFSNRHYSWLIDLDFPPQVQRTLGIYFDARDHLSGATTFAELKADAISRVDASGIPGDPIDRVLMLAHPRVLGHTFNPMTAYWCLAGEDLRAVVIEVHNTYGGRHAYVVSGADAVAGTEIDKTFYVSPFNDISGRYAVRLRTTPRQVAIRIELTDDGGPILTATLSGEARPLTRANLLRTVVARPLMTHRVSTMIRWHGIRLWLRRLPIQPGARQGGVR